MSQLIINTGNVFNDGTGDPLRVAFNAVNNNFSQIWSAGLVGSNISIANNTIQVTNTNGNLNLATNGVGSIVARATFAPDVNGIRSIGTATNRFNTVYTQYLNATGLNLSGNLYVAGNLQVVGNTVTNNYSNANIANLTIILAGGSSNAVLANNAGIIINSANANLLYNNSANSWVSTIAISAPTFIGDGANLTNVNANVDANSLLGNTLRSTILTSSLTSVGILTSLAATGDISTTGNVYANVYTGNIVTANILAGDGSNISNINAVSVIGYVPTATFANTALVANLAALATQSINADTALFAINANLSNYSNNAVFAQHANTATYAVQADNANSAVAAGIAYALVANADISVTGNLYVGNILTNGYYYANGAPFSGTGGNGVPGGNNGAVQIGWQGSFSNQGGTPGDTYTTMQFDGDGLLDINGNSAYQPRVDYTPYITINTPRVESEDFGIIAGPGIQVIGYDDSYNTPRSAYLSLQDRANVTQQWNFGILGYGSNNFSIVNATANATWTFGTDGNITLPADGGTGAASVSINFAGVGYTTANNVPTYALTGSGSGMTVDIVASNSITSVVINQAGTGYAVGDSIQVAQPSSTGNGTLIVDSVDPVTIPSINYANGQPYGGGSGPVGPNISVTGNIVADGNISANTFYIGNTPFTRTLTVGTATTPITVPLASNNSFNVLTANGSSNVVVYTT